MRSRILARPPLPRGAAGRPSDPAGSRPLLACGDAVPRRALLGLLAVMAAASSGFSQEAGDARPNIVLVMTDDQGWAQVGFHGDPVLRTPHLDRLAGESVEMTRFYVSPVCAPTRAALMTGRYNYRTGVVDTYIGRAMMEPGEVTVAEMLRDAGYRTGIFGKWHLGDNYPLRGADQGFQESVVHRGGGIGQPSDPPGSDYFDPVLFHNGEQKGYAGYVTDVFFDEALRWIGDGGGAPFFAYVPTNAPHSPYLVPDAYREPYAARGLSDRDARIYGMIANIDDNVGRLLAHLDAHDLARDTLVVFMTDNGPTTRLYHAGLRAQKGSVYENGIRVPFVVRWPARLAPGAVDAVGAHIDLAPTLLAAAGVSPPPGLAFDGLSLLPLWEGRAEAWPERNYVVQSHRGDAPSRYRAFAVVGPRYKLVQAQSFGQPAPPGAPFELYDLLEDPGETNDLAAQRPDVVERLTAAYNRWFDDVSATRGYHPVRFAIGSDRQPHVTLTRQDWRMVSTPDGWGRDQPVLGVWEVDSQSEGPYDVTVTFAAAAEADGAARIAFRGFERSVPVAAGAGQARFEDVRLQTGPGTFEASLSPAGGEPRGAWHVDVVRR
ncbi:MAG: arylsulfatase [Acidobacteria bacterium]|nr:arylsulfatase [Acidobacteriota bacterium]